MSLTLTSIEKKITKNYWTSSLGLARSSLAICTLLTLLFNDSYDIFQMNKGGELINTGIFNIFSIFGSIFYGKIVSVIILLLVISGVYPRFTAIPHFWVSYSFLTGAFMVEGGDQACAIITLYLIPLLLLDKRRNHWKTDFRQRKFGENLIGYFTYYSILIQVAVIYFHASVGKYGTEEWVDGTAVYYWLNDPTFGMNKYMLSYFNELLKNPYFVQTLSWGTMFLEILLFTRLFYTDRRYIRLTFLLGIALHSGIILFFGLVSFFFAMLGALVLYTLWQEEIVEKIIFKTKSLWNSNRK